VIRQLRETDIVMGGIQARQADRLKDHQEWLGSQHVALARHQEFVARHELMAEMEDKLNGMIAATNEFQEAQDWAWARDRQVMAEMEEKLNGLIAFVDNMTRRPKDAESA
jgi:hypothetical protein